MREAGGDCDGGKKTARTGLHGYGWGIWLSQALRVFLFNVSFIMGLFSLYRTTGHKSGP